MEEQRLTTDRDEIIRALQTVCQGRLTEIRAFDGNRIYFGYFDDYAAAAAAVVRLERCKGIYFVPNEIDSDLIARSSNRISQARRGETTGDHHVLRRRWLLVDLDPTRVAGISSKENEKQAALAMCRRIYGSLRAMGFSDPVVADSGNGYHLMYPTDESPDDEGLFERCLHALEQKFGDAHVSIDEKVFNPARIWKLYGTVSRKGDHTEDRPHRRAKIVRVPEEVIPTPIDKLHELAAMWTPPTPPDRGSTTTSAASPEWSLERWLTQRRIRILQGPDQYKGGRRWRVPCPFNDEHERDAAVFETAEGKPGFTCFHNSCAANKWQQFREHHEPGCYDRAVQEPTRRNRQPRIQSHPVEIIESQLAEHAVRYVNDIGEVDDGLLQTGIPELDENIGGGIGEGEFVVIAARPSHGKTMYALQLTYNLAIRNPGLIVSEEMSPTLLGKRAVQHVSDVHQEYWFSNKNRVRDEVVCFFRQRQPIYVEHGIGNSKRVAEYIRKYKEQHDIKFVIVDYVQLLTGAGTSRFEGVTEASLDLKRVCSETGVTMIVLAQFNREIEKDKAMIPRMSHLRESGQLEQDGDVILGLVWPYKHDSSKPLGLYQIFILKNKNRETLKSAIELTFEPSRQRVLGLERYVEHEHPRQLPREPGDDDEPAPDPITEEEQSQLPF